MALDYSIDKEAHEALDEGKRALYKADGEGYVLDLAGGPDPDKEIKSKHAALHDRHRELLKERDELNKRFEGVDPAVYRQQAEKIKELEAKGVAKGDDVDTKVKAAIDAAVAPLTEALAAEKAAREKAELEADGARKDRLFAAEARKAGVRDNAIPMLQHALGAMEYDAEGNPTLKGQPLAEAVSAARGEYSYLFGESKGAGSKDGDGAGGEAKDPWKMNTKELIEHAERSTLSF